jgi:hypothetical protein
MNNRFPLLSILAVTLALLITPSQRAAAEVTDEQFKALENSVEKMQQQLQQLVKLHEQDQATHAADQQKIQSLETQLGQTMKTATDAQQKADAAAQVQPVHPVPDSAYASHNFTMVGDAEVQFGKTSGQNSGFLFADFAPIFLFRARDNVLFEAGFDFFLQNGGTPPVNSGTSYNFDLSFATIDYLMNDYMTLVAGQMLLPLGTYSERSAGWLNIFPDNPLPRSILPANGIGVQLRGAAPIGQSGQMLTYSAYAVNGPSSMDGTGAADQLDLNGNVGVKSDGSTANLHSAPAGGGRIGWFLPFKPHYDLELGISGQSGQWDNAGSLLWSAAVLDFSTHISPYFRVNGEVMQSWQQTTDLGTVKPHGWWIQGGYKLAGLNLDLPMISNLELVTRYDTVNDDLGTTTKRNTLGYVYYISNTLWFEGDYEWYHNPDPNRFVFQISYGF